ncbi:ubiquitin-like-specific protease ESD4 [Silene latifolia]|uniref:ubiquitin-like-specific protease ESD4 n=1 Tax=Silene latifolia TaxID=37657 RepID=UPI003D7883C6
MVSTPWMNVTREALHSLGPTGLIMDEVIDIFGIKCTFNRRNLFYLPTTIFSLHRENNPEIWAAHIKDSYTPSAGSHIDKVFIPLHSNTESMHWWACVCDIKQAKNFILDSCMAVNVDPDNKHAKEIVHHVSAILGGSYNSLEFMHMNEFVNVKVPQQKTSYDCGVFLLKWLSALDDDSLWTKSEYYEKLAQYRKSIIFELLRWDKNTIKVFN